MSGLSLFRQGISRKWSCGALLFTYCSLRFCAFFGERPEPLALRICFLVVLIADAAQDAMASEYKSITEGAVLIGTIPAWDYLLDWISHEYPWFHRLISPAPLPLIKNGQVMKKHLRQELITEEELLSQLRQQGAQNPAEVKRYYLEGNARLV